MHDSYRSLVRGCTNLMGLLALLCTQPASAAWPTDPLVNLPLCSAPRVQDSPVIVSDGSGGSIVAWVDFRDSTDSGIYAQHALASGSADPQWPVDGTLLSSADGDEGSPAIVSDGAGGAIVTWFDARGGTTYDIYAQHVLADGTLDPQWPADGRALCTALSDQYGQVIATDGAGGAIVAWQDWRGTDLDIYAQHVLATGAVDPAWPANGRAVCTAVNSQYKPRIVGDGSGGAIVTWFDQRSTSAIFAQRVLASGAVDPAWPANGRSLGTASGGQEWPTITTDGAGGALVAWVDFRSGSQDVYGQHVLATGSIAPGWLANGLVVSGPLSADSAPEIVSDASGGAIVAWHQATLQTDLNIHAQHLLGAGGLDPAWPVLGAELCTSAGDQFTARVISDELGGAIVAWSDFRNLEDQDVYAQRVLANGVVDPTWPADGRALSTADEHQAYPTIAPDSYRGAIVAWRDDRVSGFSGADIYAQRVLFNGELGGDVVGVPGELSRSLHLGPARPNPARGGAFTVQFTLASDAAAALEVYDVTGRRMARRELESFGAGPHTLDLGSDLKLAPGVYLIRLVQGAHERVTRFARLD